MTPEIFIIVMIDIMNYSREIMRTFQFEILKV